MFTLSDDTGTITRVLVVADDLLARAGLAALLAEQPHVVVVGQAPGDSRISDEIELYRPTAVVWDMGWQPSEALDVLADGSDDWPPVVVLLSDESYASTARSSGARGILRRDVDARTLAAALDAVSNGLMVQSPELAVPSPPHSAPSTDPAPELTPRETEVLRLLAEGLSNKALAYRLDISEHTVKFHVNSLMSKLGAQSRTEAVVFATRMGLVPI